MPRPIHEIAAEISKCWSPVNYAAVPYLRAMHSLNSVNDIYFIDSGRSIITYFLGNARGWRGEDARRIKAELRSL